MGASCGNGLSGIGIAAATLHTGAESAAFVPNLVAWEQTVGSAWMIAWFSVQHEGDAAYVSLGDDIGCFASGGVEEFRAALGRAARVEMSICGNGGDALVG